jgi:polar amino acid transport system substrate-binding protein
MQKSEEDKKMKKLTAMMLVGMMTAAMVSGCGSTKTEEAAAPAETDDAVEEESQAEPVEEEAEEESSAEDSDLAYVQEKGTLVVGITDFEPMDYKDQSGEWIGFDADMAKAFAESLGVDVEFVEIDWDNKILELDGKTIDCVWNGMTLTAETESAMECSNAYCNNAQIVIVPADKADQYQDVDSLSELNFAVEAGSAGEEQVSQLGLNYTPVKAQSDALMEVAAGTSDAAVIDSLMAAAMVGEGTGYADLAYTIGLNSEEYGVGFRKGSDLAAELNAFFAASYADGSMQTCAETYGVQAALIAQ